MFLLKTAKHLFSICFKPRLNLGHVALTIILFAACLGSSGKTTQLYAQIGESGEPPEPTTSRDIDPDYERTQFPTLSRPLCQLDVAFVADGSGSISATNFLRIKDFIKAFLANVNVSNSGSFASVIQFSSQGTGRVVSSLTGDLNNLNASIDTMVQLGGNTDIQEGIALGAEELQSRGRGGVARVMIVLTDGQHNQPGDPLLESRRFQESGGSVYTIAVGNAVDINDLIDISSQPYTRYLYNVSDANSLSGILSSIAENVCTCREGNSSDVTTTRIAEGLCLKIVSDRIYIGIADIANPNIRLKSIHTLPDPNQGQFQKRSLRGHVESDPALMTRTCAPASIFGPPIGLLCYDTPTNFYVATNGVGHLSQDFRNVLDRPSPDSILAINGVSFSDYGPGIPMKPRSSFFVFDGSQGTIHRAYRDASAPLPSFPIPTDLNGDFTAARTYIGTAITNSRFAVGYRATILDTLSNPPVVGGDGVNDPISNSELTSIGVSGDGKTIYLAVAKPGVGPRALAQSLMNLGAVRAVLLDGSSSSQFASFRESYSAFFPNLSELRIGRPIVNGLVAYNITGTLPSSVAVATGARQTLSPYASVLFPSGTFTSAGRITLNTILIDAEVRPTASANNTSIASTDALESASVITLTPPLPPLRHAGFAQVMYVQNLSGVLLQPRSDRGGYKLEANFDLIDYPPGTSPGMMGLYFWNGSEWVREPTSRVNAQTMSVSAQPKRLGLWAIFADPRVWMPLVTK